jgi:hypothetical protein
MHAKEVIKNLPDWQNIFKNISSLDSLSNPEIRKLIFNALNSYYEDGVFQYKMNHISYLTV